jgi:HD-GYP domain-containing protein (c-di-GMP phosphodiesterase class II)
MIKPEKESFFSISTSLVPVQVPLTYSLYINVSGEANREHFIRIFPDGGILEPGEVDEFKRKYRQLYVAESQRSAYMDAVIKSSGRTGIEKTSVLKDSAIHYLGNLFDGKREITTEVLNQSIAGCRDVVENMVDVIQSYNVDQLQQMIANLSFHDFYTYDHSINVSMYCVVIYRAMYPKASKIEIVQAGLGGMLHDLGKINISTQIINKSGDLTPEERKEIQKHPDYGLQFLSTPGVTLPTGVDPILVSRVVHEHHENFDGTGYPSKLANNQIHILARITAVADFFDAVTTKRSYHDALTSDDALALMKKTEGKKLDPKIFQLFAEHTKLHNDLTQTLIHLELPSDFDPCQPHHRLPFQQMPNQSPEKPIHFVPKVDEIQSLLQSRTLALNNLEKSPFIDHERTRPMIESALELSFSLYSQHNFKPLVHELLKVTTTTTLKIIGHNPQLQPLLLNLRVDERNYTAAHSLLLAELCCAIASKVGWESEPTFSKLITAAFLHDIALGNHPMAKFQRVEELSQGQHFSAEEIERFRRHPEKASEYARELIGSPAELETILAQHHELADGTGFPHRLAPNQITPLSCLFIIAHDILLFFLEKGKAASWETWVSASASKFEAGSFKKILKNLVDSK